MTRLLQLLLGVAPFLWPGQPSPVTVADLHRFPTRQAADNALGFHDRRAEWLERQRSLWFDDGHLNAIYAAREDNAARRAAWSVLRSAYIAIDVPPLEEEKGCTRLTELRTLIGPDAYRLGLMPGPIDWRYATPIDR